MSLGLMGYMKTAMTSKYHYFLFNFEEYPYIQCLQFMKARVGRVRVKNDIVVINTEIVQNILKYEFTTLISNRF